MGGGKGSPSEGGAGSPTALGSGKITLLPPPKNHSHRSEQSLCRLPPPLLLKTAEWGAPAMLPDVLKQRVDPVGVQPEIPAAGKKGHLPHR